MTGDRRKSKSMRHHYSKGDLEKSPMLVFYEITQACDLVCQHCRACAQPKPHSSELSPSESRNLVDQLCDFPHFPMLVLTGGDPLKREDVFDLIEYGTDRGLEVSLTPSATPLVTREALRHARDAGMARLAVSIDGSDALTHDGTRGVTGSFRRTLEILADANDLGISLQVNTTVTRNNVAQIEAMADMLADYGIALWSLFFLVPVGRGAVLDRMNAEECEAAFADLWRQAQRQPYPIKTTEAPHYRRYVIQQQAASKRAGKKLDAKDPPRAFTKLGLNDGKGIMFVSHAGLIHPSGFLPIVCGMFPLDSVVRVYQQSPIFRKLRDSDSLEGKCRPCEFRKICGGSRARTYAMTGNLFAEEPDCAYQPTGSG